MGYDRIWQTFHIQARLSRHNDELDKRHDELWDELQRRCTDAIAEIISEEKYKEIEAS